MATFGKFSKDGKVYIIDKPLAPVRHLVNFSWNSNLISGVNQFGTGEGVFNNQTLLYNNPAGRARMIRDGRRYFYISDEERGAYWNIGYFPVKHEPFELITEFGPGYSRFHHTTENIKTSSLCFAAHDEPVEIWEIKIINLGTNKRSLKVYPYVEWLLQGYPMASDYYSYLKSEYIEDINTLISFNLSDERPHERYTGFVASNLKPMGYTGSIREFMGVYGEPSRPRRLEQGKDPNHYACNENLAGSLEIPVTLDAKEQKELVILIGNTSDTAETKRIVNKVLKGDYVDQSFQVLQDTNEKRVKHTFVKTPEERINILTNIWVKNQVALCAEFGRDGVRGFRDTLQDAWAILSFNPDIAREKIIESLKHQYRDGSALRGWMPIMTKHYSDGPTWIIPVVVDYIKQTGDTSLLKQTVSYFDEGRGTVLEHMLAALGHLRKERGHHGLCLAFQGDWNDSLDWMGKGGKGESVMTSMAYYLSLKHMQQLNLHILKDENLKEEITSSMVEIQQAVETHAWDGEWYIQGYSDAGTPVGSKQNDQGMLSLIPQAWAAYSGIASRERIEKAFAAVEKYLSSSTGCVMCYPAFTSRDDHVGRLTVILPGMYENASTYCNGSAFMIAAYLLEGKANQALELYKQVMPDSADHPADLSGVEPYAFTNQYLGPDNKRAGASISGWITGTAGWMYRIMVHYFLGVRPDFNGVYITPCIPDEWDEASITTNLHDTEYHIEIIRNKEHAWSMTVNGIGTKGNYIPYGDEKRIEVKIYC